MFKLGDIVYNQASGRYAIYVKQLAKSDLCTVFKIRENWVPSHSCLVIAGIEGRTSWKESMLTTTHGRDFQFSESAKAYAVNIVTMEGGGKA